MNRKRIGLAALVVGAGAAIRQRTKSQVADAAAPAKPHSSTPVDQVTADFAHDDHVADSAPAPDVATDAGASGDLEAGAVASAAATSDLLADAAPAAPEIEPVSLGDPTLTISDVDHDVAIKLPTMPEAGSSFSPPAIVIPGAAASSADASVGGSSLMATRAASSADASEGGSSVVATRDASSAEVGGSSLMATRAASSPDASVGGSSLMSTPSAATESVLTATPTTPPPSSNGGPTYAPVAKEPFYRAHRGWSIAGSLLLGLVVVAVIAASVIRLPYYSLEPGSVYDTIERVEAPGDLVSIPDGDIGFVTVAQTANISPWQWLDAKLDQNIVIRHEDEVQGDQTADELREADIRRMQVSKSSAVVVALEKLGFELILTPLGVEVAQVFDCTAADGTLGTGDLIVGVNGVEVRTGEELVDQLLGQGIGADIELLVERIDPNNPTQSLATDLVALTLGSADAACLPDEVRTEEPRPFIGIGTLPIFDEELPIEVDVRTGAVSGPSAGLAFTLAIIDVLSEGELTNGLNVVTTGTIDRDGNVGPVGGIHQKTIAAERSGADVFIVPNCCENFVSTETGEPIELPSNYEEALLYADDMIVIGVDTLDDALIALGELGGDVDAFLDETSS